MKYSKEQISFCIEILKNPQGCFGSGQSCSICLVEKECQTEFFFKRRCSKEAAIQIIKEILE